MMADRFQAGPCKKSETRRLRALLNEVFITERGNDGDLFDYAPLLYSEENLENLRVVREGKQIVGHAGILPRAIRWRGQTLQAGLIGGVCARQQLRGEGIGTLAMQDVAERMAELELDFGLLWTGSHEFYQRLGWRLGGGSATMQIREAAGQVAGGHEIMPLRESPFSFEDCHRLHLKAARHEVVRTCEESRLLMAGERCSISIALEGGRMVGYAASTGDTIRELEGPAEACITMIEHAASQGLHRCLFPLNDPRLEPIRQALPVHLDLRPLGMFLIVNSSALVEKIVAETGKEAEQMGIGAGASREMLMMGIFGGPEREPAEEPLPLDIHVGHLDHV